MVNKIVSYLSILFIGIALGYSWHYQQTKDKPDYLKEWLEEIDVNQSLQKENSFLKDMLNLKVFRGEKIKVKTTGYCNHPICITNKKIDGITAAGTIAKVGTCASDWNVFPKGTVFFIEGYGFCKVEDKGSKVKGKHLDLFFGDFTRAKIWGVKNIEVIRLKGE